MLVHIRGSTVVLLPRFWCMYINKCNIKWILGYIMLVMICMLTLGVSVDQVKKLGISMCGKTPMPRELAFPLGKTQNWHDVYDIIRCVCILKEIRITFVCIYNYIILLCLFCVLDFLQKQIKNHLILFSFQIKSLVLLWKVRA